MTCVLIRLQIETFLSLLFALSRYLQNKGHEGKNHTFKTTLLNQVLFFFRILVCYSPKQTHITYVNSHIIFLLQAYLYIRDRNIDYKISLIYNMFH